DKRDGTWVSYYANGKKSTQSSFAHGQRQGELLLWFDNGQPKAIDHYADGKPDGTWVEFTREGQKRDEWSYDHGVLAGPFPRGRPAGEREEPAQPKLPDVPLDLDFEGPSSTPDAKP